MSLLLSLALATAWSAEPEFRSAAELLDTFKGEPTVREVQLMTMEYSKTDPAYVEAWLKAGATTNLLPKIDFWYAYGDGQGDDYDYVSNEALLDKTSVDNKNTITAKAQWNFSKALMSSERIRVISEAQDIVKLRDKVLEEVTRLYFERRKLQVDMVLNAGDFKAQVKNELRLQELTAQLDAFTGGRFGKALKK
jgi:hypothetical protein